MGSDNPKKKQKPKLSTRIKRWYDGERDPAEALALLSEYEAKERRKKPKNQGRRARQKGAEFERLIANRLAALWPNAERNTQCKGGKKDGCDIEGTPWFVEAKNCAVLQLPAWWRQAREDCDDRPIAIIYSVQNSPVVRVQMEMSFNHCDPIEFDVDFEDWVRWQRGNYGLHIEDNMLGKLMVTHNGEVMGRVELVTHTEERKGKTFEVVRFKATGQDGVPLPNPHKAAVDGLWSSLDAAEAAVRKAAQ